MCLKFYISMLFAIPFLISTATYANNSKTADTITCEHLVGSWNGTGHAKQGKIICTYTGKGEFKHLSDKNYQASISLTYKSGGAICPASSHQFLKGTCTNSQVEINDGNVHLSGKLQNMRLHLTGYSTDPKAELDANLTKN